ncbi:MAG TPA: class D beta-lactamase [Chthoniobacterales bacterium]|nr:class D beta-lactamase [Chthoniobacterales bacterium]
MRVRRFTPISQIWGEGLPRLVTVLIFLLASLQALSARTYEETPELAKIFEDHGVAGTFVLFDVTTDTMFVSNEARAKKRFTPASTFKIANSLIGLDVGAVKSVDEVLPYGGKPQPRKEWERDMGLRGAIKVSNVPVYQELARRIGLERMREGVKKLGYGNMEIGNVVDRFWLDGPLAISAVEQTTFLHRLVKGSLPISPEAVRAVKEITLLEKTTIYKLHAKAGWWVGPTPPQIGWWVGWIERENKVYPFALNIDMLKDEDAAKRIPLGRDCLKTLGKL